MRCSASEDTDTKVACLSENHLYQDNTITSNKRLRETGQEEKQFLQQMVDSLDEEGISELLHALQSDLYSANDNNFLIDLDKLDDERQQQLVDTVKRIYQKNSTHSQDFQDRNDIWVFWDIARRSFKVMPVTH